jgi:hypothetical protein
MATKTKTSTSKKSTSTKRSPRPKGAKTTVTPPTSQEQPQWRRHFTEVKRWLHATRPRKPSPLTWKDDATLDQYEGREGDDIRVLLTPYVDTRKLPKKLITGSQKVWAKEVKKAKENHGIRLNHDIPLTIQRPAKNSGLQIYNAVITGLTHLSNGGAVLYQLTAKDVPDAKSQVAELVVKCRLHMVDALLSQLTGQLDRPPEAVLYSALSELYKQHGTDKWAKEHRSCLYSCQVRM